MTCSIYDSRFFDAIDRTSLASAQVIVPLVRKLVPFESVVDVGCGRGAWLRVFKEYGAQTIAGYDGNYVDRSDLLIPDECFRVADLCSSFNFSGAFDLAVCLEVAEHLPRKAAKPLIAALCQLAPAVLFSAAIPGQGGTNHVNEQWPQYWSELFERHNYLRLDSIRPEVIDCRDVAWWYKQNLFLYVRANVIEGSEALLRERERTQSMDVTVLASRRLEPLLSTRGRWNEFARGVVHSIRNRLNY